MSTSLQQKTLSSFWNTMEWLEDLAVTDPGGALDVLSMMTRELQAVSDSLVPLSAKPAELRVIRSP